MWIRSIFSHIERSSVLFYLIDVLEWKKRDFAKQAAYRRELLDKSFLDWETAMQNLEIFKQKYPYPKTTLFPISAGIASS